MAVERLTYGTRVTIAAVLWAQAVPRFTAGKGLIAGAFPLATQYFVAQRAYPMAQRGEINA